MKIESVSNKKIKEYTKLHLKKERDKSNLFLVEGKHMVEEAYKANLLKELFVLENTEPFIDFEMIECTQAVLNKLSNQVSNAKMIGVCTKPKEEIQDAPSSILLLDSVQDPGNVGTLIRTAHSFGIDEIILSKECCDIYNPKTIQSSQGALFYIPIRYANLEEEIPSLQNQGVTVYATALHHKSKSLQDTVKKTPYAILLGNEGQGVKSNLIEMCDACIKIEMDTFESLNVAIAGSICMYTFKYAK